MMALDKETLAVHQAHKTTGLVPSLWGYMVWETLCDINLIDNPRYVVAEKHAIVTCIICLGTVLDE